jgi:hypothetical protein
LKQEKVVSFHHVCHIQCLPVLHAGMEVLHISGSYVHTQVVYRKIIVFAPFCAKLYACNTSRAV